MNAPRTIALSIDTSMLRAVTAVQRRRATVLERSFELSLSHGLVTASVPTDPKAFGELLGGQLRQLFGKTSLPRFACLAVPDALCFLFSMTMQSTGEETMDEAVRWEAGQHIPLAVDELTIDWQRIREDGDTSLIQVCAAPTKALEAYAAAFEAAQLLPAAFEPASLSALRALDVPESLDSFFFLYFGATETVLFFLSPEGIPLRLLVPHFSQQSLHAMLTSRFQIAEEDLPRFMEQFGFDEDAHIGDALEAELQPVFDTWTRYHEYLKENGMSVQSLPTVLAGEPAAMKGLQERVEKFTRGTVLTPKLRPQLWSRRTSDADRQRSSLSAVTFGLALRTA